MVKKLHLEIVPHMTAEEESLYSTLKKSEESRETAAEALEEHHVAQMVLKELIAMPGSDERFRAKAAVLKELIFHHIEEEESEVFNIFKKVIKNDEAADILEAFQKSKSRKKKAMEKVPAMA